ncbi:uncharacterized protein isoform X2 [Rhodnius prolixus]|uniref:uncharacterized protein isoform X2 n=1 Tax=Rhodnius prolixus TaxID=13249 RepID=UPI003D1896DD
MQRPYFTAPRISVSEKHRYKLHLDSIRLPLKKINDEAPPLPGSTYIKPGILEKDSLRLAEIERENRNLVRRINVIGRTKGKVDCTPTFLLGSTNYVERKRKNEKIETLNLQLYNRFQTTKSKYNKDEFMEDYKNLKKKFIEKPDHVAYKAKVAESLEWTIAPANIDKTLLDPSKRIRCFFDIAVKGKKKMGRLVMEIWMDIAPVAGCNFVQLCKGYGEYSYKKTPFHRIIKDTFCVGGDVVNKSGTGIFSVYGGVNSTFSDENATLEFNGPGVLAAHTVFAGDNHSQFLITFQKLTTMNKYFVVFGRIIGSIRTLELVRTINQIIIIKMWESEQKIMLK